MDAGLPGILRPRLCRLRGGPQTPFPPIFARVYWRSRLSLLLFVGLVGCGGQADSPVTDLPNATQAAPPTTLIRFSADGGKPRLYTPATLSAIDWRVPAGDVPPAERAVGADLDQRLAFLLTQDRTVVGLDLTSGRVRTFLDSVAYAVLGPSGTLFSVDQELTVSQLHRRTPVRMGAQLEAVPVAAYGTRTGRLMTVSDTGSAALTVLSGDQPPVSVPLPHGATAATYWGDLLAVATDSGMVLYEPRATEQVRFVPMTPAPTSMVFSPSGNRIYTAGRDSLLRVFDRYGEQQLAAIDLPGVAESVRSDPYGIWLLLRPIGADSVWVVDVGTNTLIGQAETAWAGDFPTIIGNTLLIRQGGDITALDVTQEIFEERGRIVDGGTDIFLTVAWTPRDDDRYDELLALDAVDSKATSATIYLQISSSRNPAWAQNLVNLMEAAGLPATMLQPGEGEDAYRVVIGPYATREEADTVARSLGRPSFIYQQRNEFEP